MRLNFGFRQQAEQKQEATLGGAKPAGPDAAPSTGQVRQPQQGTHTGVAERTFAAQMERQAAPAPTSRVLFVLRIVPPNVAAAAAAQSGEAKVDAARAASQEPTAPAAEAPPAQK